MFDPTKPPATLAELAHRSFTDCVTQPFLGTKSKGDNAYHYASYGEVALRVRNLAGGLASLGLDRGQRAAILSENSPEWAIADMACQMTGLISVPMFATLPAVQVAGILKDCGASLVFVSDAGQKKKVDAVRDQLPDLKHVIISEVPKAEEGEAPTAGLISFAELEQQGAAYGEAHPGDYEATWPAAAPDDVATIIYTSGTTGEPKGAMLTQRNIAFNAEAIAAALREVYGEMREEVFLSFLPLAHVYERTAGFWMPIRLGAAIAYCESLFTVDKNMGEARPTMMLCVPRLYESMREKLQKAASSMDDKQREKYLDALALAQKAGAARGKQEGAPSLSLPEQLKLKVYDAMVYSKIRDKMGGRMRAFVSGGAPIHPDLGALFTGLGLTILEGYGLTETSPVMAVNRPGRIHLGTVGEPLQGVELRIAEDGEILTRGPSVMKGYWNKPEQTREALDAEGWFHTGDIGVFENNYLKITDRKKDLLVLANGKKVAPAPIELGLAESPYIAQAVLLGDKRKAVTALIVPQLDAVREWAKKEGVDAEDNEALLKTAPVQKLFRSEIDRLTPNLADFERIRKFVVLPHAFSVEAGELTPSLKVKRRFVADKYRVLLGDEE